MDVLVEPAEFTQLRAKGSQKVYAESLVNKSLNLFKNWHNVSPLGPKFLECPTLNFLCTNWCQILALPLITVWPWAALMSLRCCLLCIFEGLVPTSQSYCKDRWSWGLFSSPPPWTLTSLQTYILPHHHPLSCFTSRLGSSPLLWFGVTNSLPCYTKHLSGGSPLHTPFLLIYPNPWTKTRGLSLSRAEN